jgi:hypothetical protein
MTIAAVWRESSALKTALRLDVTQDSLNANIPAIKQCKRAAGKVSVDACNGLGKMAHHKPQVLFLSTRHATRSQMAEGLLRAFGMSTLMS